MAHYFVCFAHGDREPAESITPAREKSDYLRSPSVGLDVALALLKGPRNERSTQLIVKPELWLGVFVIVPGVLMALKQTLSA